MKFDKLQPGMAVYSITTETMGNTHVRTVSVRSVKIISVDPERETVMAEWNSNPARKFHANQYGLWRKEKPLLIRSIIGSARLATREEIAAEKIKQKAVQNDVKAGL